MALKSVLKATFTLKAAGNKFGHMIERWNLQKKIRNMNYFAKGKKKNILQPEVSF